VRARASFDGDATVDERSRLSGVRVLLVDDNQDARELGARTLALAAAEVETAASAEEGIAKLRHFRPHVLLSDIEMPFQDGYQFLARVRSLPDAEGGAVPAAAITAFAGAEDRRRALAAGFAIHLAKPVAGRALIGAVTRLAQQANQSRIAEPD
jgi:CheY-like chemotaxis protein